MTTNKLESVLDSKKIIGSKIKEFSNNIRIYLKNTVNNLMIAPLYASLFALLVGSSHGQTVEALNSVIAPTMLNQTGFLITKGV